MRPVILPRKDRDWEDEAEAAAKYFNVLHYRPQVVADNLVIARFSAVPFYREQALEYKYVGARMINSYAEHLYIADLREWYADLMEFTPKTWTQLHTIPDEGPFVLKGITNSKKFLWKTHMFAQNKQEAIQVHSRLTQDSMIAYQDIVIREYVPLHTYMIGLQGMPVTKEFRFFFYKGNLLSGGYYWSSHMYDLEDAGIKPDIAEVPLPWLMEIARIVAKKATFFVLDVAQTESGKWILIEVNDGQQSGLSENNPDVLYRNLKMFLQEDGHDA